jgi:hypothetical protein
LRKAPREETRRKKMEQSDNRMVEEAREEAKEENQGRNGRKLQAREKLEGRSEVDKTLGTNQ